MDKRVEKTREAIAGAYFALQEEKAGNRITISDIARKANIDRKTFYLHYDTVEDIVKDYALKKVKKVMAEVRIEKSSRHPFRMDQLFEVLNRTVTENLGFFKFVLNHYEYNYFFEWTKKMFCDLLMEQYRSSCDFSELELQIYTEYYISAILSAYALWLKQKAPCPIEELAGYVKKATFGGLDDVLEGREKESDLHE